jgi:hypothetical protein
LNKNTDKIKNEEILRVKNENLKLEKEISDIEESFEKRRIDLQTPKRENQSNYTPYPLVFRKQRKRIETLFSQLSDYLMMKRNYAKTFQGLSTRTISKIAAVTVLQYINFQNKNPINNIKHALAA